MKSIHNAVTDTLEELELEEHIECTIRAVREHILYHVTFQERENGNRQAVIAVEYSVGDILNDIAGVDLCVVRCEGMRPMLAEMIMETLAVTIDPDYFDSDDDTTTISSQPSTPLP
jgi:hypothetical protein